VSDTYKIVYSKVIFQAIKDLVGSQQSDREAAIKYLKSPVFPKHCRVAGFPAELQDALDEMLLLSRTQQRIVAQLVMEELA
jgi:hypothetical protein|tara:strand:- start:218 stop:460 length:243 start_codon:yes stop_codon:yes gene_type:complete